MNQYRAVYNIPLTSYKANNNRKFLFYRSESETDVESSQRSPSKLEQILGAAPPFLTDKTVPIAKDQQLLMAKVI